MADLLERKAVGKTSAHVERAMRAVDACLVALRKNPQWCFREIKTTGLQKENPRPSPHQADVEVHELTASVQITGAFDNEGRLRYIDAHVEFAGKEIIHDPSGNLAPVLDIRSVEITIRGPKEQTYTFTSGYIPGERP